MGDRLVHYLAHRAVPAGVRVRFPDARLYFLRCLVAARHEDGVLGFVADTRGVLPSLCV